MYGTHLGHTVFVSQIMNACRIEVVPRAAESHTHAGREVNHSCVMLKVDNLDAVDKSVTHATFGGVVTYRVVTVCMGRCFPEYYAALQGKGDDDTLQLLPQSCSEG